MTFRLRWRVHTDACTTRVNAVRNVARLQCKHTAWNLSARGVDSSTNTCRRGSRTHRPRTHEFRTQSSRTQSSRTHGSRTQGSRTQEPTTYRCSTQSSRTQGSRTQSSQTQSSRTQGSRTQSSRTLSSRTHGSRTQGSSTYRCSTHGSTHIPVNPSRCKKTLKPHWRSASLSKWDRSPAQTLDLPLKRCQRCQSRETLASRGGKLLSAPRHTAAATTPTATAEAATGTERPLQ